MKKQLLIFTFSLLFAGQIIAQSIAVSLNPNPVEAGSNLTLNITYTNSNPNDIIYAALELKDSNGVWVSTIEEFTANPVGASGTDVPLQIVLAIPVSTTPSTALPSGHYYDLKIELNEEGWNGWLAGTYPVLTIAAQGTLSASDFEKNAAKLFPNPVANELNLIAVDANTNFNFYEIYNVLGKRIVPKTTLNSNKVNVSGISKGIYFIKLDDFKPIKFIKK